jgi:hypothetical protein
MIDIKHDNEGNLIFLMRARLVSEEKEQWFQVKRKMSSTERPKLGPTFKYGHSNDAEDNYMDKVADFIEQSYKVFAAGLSAQLRSGFIDYKDGTYGRWTINSERLKSDWGIYD